MHALQQALKLVLPRSERGAGEKAWQVERVVEYQPGEKLMGKGHCLRDAVGMLNVHERLCI